MQSLTHILMIICKRACMWASSLAICNQTLKNSILMRKIQFSQEKSLKIHECERYGYSDLFSMNWVKTFSYTGKSMETNFPYLGIV